jgi:tRNA/tmRNA/rRNA uracil-C5-methylase (TrmA/RlmC/RlmD family)
MSADHFSIQSREYANYRPTYPEELFEWIASNADRKDIAWDCACGSGQATTGLSQIAKKSTGMDPIPELRKTVESVFPSESVQLIWPISIRVGRLP